MSKSSLPVPETASGRAIREMQEHERLRRQAYSGLSSGVIDELLKQRKLLSDLDKYKATSLAGQAIRGAMLPSTLKASQGINPIIEQARQISQLASNVIAYGGYSPAVSPNIPTTSPPQATTITTAADIGALVRKARKGMKMNQSEFALHAGVGRRFLSELENGKASLEFDKVVACAAAAGIDLIPKVRRGA